MESFLISEILLFIIKLVTRYGVFFVFIYIFAKIFKGISKQTKSDPIRKADEEYFDIPQNAKKYKKEKYNIKTNIEDQIIGRAKISDVLLFEDRDNDWLAKQRREEATCNYSEARELKYSHKKSCDAKKLKNIFREI